MLLLVIEVAIQIENGDGGCAVMCDPKDLRRERVLWRATFVLDSKVDTVNPKDCGVLSLMPQQWESQPLSRSDFCLQCQSRDLLSATN